MASSNPPTSYGVLLFPGFEVLDIAGPLECLNILTTLRQEGAPLTLSIIGRPDPSSPTSPQDLTPAAPNREIGGFSFKSQQIYRPTHTFATAPPLDVLLIPGGFGTRDPTRNCADELAFIARVYPSLRYLFTICTGSLLAAAAGVLDGHRATSNKASWGRATSYGPRTYWVARARWVASGNIWTTSGVSAGTDGMLAFLAHVYDEARWPGLVDGVVNAMEYNREVDSSCDPFCDVFKAEDVPPKEGIVPE